MKLYRLLFLSLLFLPFFGCNDENSEVEETPYIELSQISVDCSYSGKTFDIEVIANCAWYVYEKPDWIILDKMEGYGNSVIKATIEANSDSDKRIGKILIVAKDHDISTGVSIEQSWQYNHYEDKW